MVTKHTPGPWYVHEYASCDSAYAEGAETHIFAYDPIEGSTVALVNRWTFHDDPPTPESSANARLIAAAPEMLEALKLMAKSLNGSAFDTAGMLAAHRAVDAAIAKAEGGAQ